MQNAVWKLSAMAGVIGIGLLVMLQAQRGLSQSEIARPEARLLEIEENPLEAPDLEANAALGAAEPLPAAETAPVPDRTVAVDAFGVAPARSSGEPRRLADFPSARRLRNSGSAAEDDLDRPATAHDFQEKEAAESRSAPPLLVAAEPVPADSEEIPDEFEADPFAQSPAPATTPQSRVRPVSFEDETEATDPTEAEAVDLTLTADPFASPADSEEADEETEPFPARTSATSRPPLTLDDSGPAAALDKVDPFGPQLLHAGEPADTSEQPAETSEDNAIVEQPSSSGAPPELQALEPLPRPKSDGPGTKESQSPLEFDPFGEGQPPAELKTEEAQPVEQPEEEIPADTADRLPVISPGATQQPVTIRSVRDGRKPGASAPSDVIERPASGRFRSDSEDVEVQGGSPGLERIGTPQLAPAETASHRASSRTAAEPHRLKPAPEAVKLQNTPDLRGDGTVDGASPRGPQRPQLRIEKIAPPQAVLGQPMVYTIVVKNIGGEKARQILVEDRIPKGTELTGTAPQAEMIGKRLLWRLGELEPQEEHTISVRIVPFEEGQIGSVATVSFVAEVAAQTVIQAPQLNLELQSPPSAKAGEQIELHFKLTNNGDGDATGVVIRTLIPDTFKHPAGNDLEYAVGRLAAGDSREVKLTVAALEPGEAVHRAILTADGGLSLESTAEVDVVAEKLTISRTGPKRLFAGRNGAFSNTVTNDGEIRVEGITLVEELPEGSEFVEASDGGRFDAAERTVTWQADGLDPGESRTFQLTVLAKERGTRESTVTATSDSGTAVQVSSKTSVEGFASLSISAFDEKQPLAVGERFTSHLRLKNTGNAPATNVGLTLSLPPEVRLVSVEGPVEYEENGGMVTFTTVPELAAREDLSIEVVLEPVSEGEARLEIELSADHLSSPVNREEALTIFSDGE